MLQMNKKLNQLLNKAKKKRTNSKNNSTIIERFFIQKDKQQAMITLFSDYI